MQSFHDLLLIASVQAKVEMTPLSFALYDEAIEEAGLTQEQATKALRSLMKSMRSWQLPTPAQVVEAAMPKVPDNLHANNTAGMIIQAIEKFGYNQGTQAMNFLGAFGWLVVQRFGGWYRLCTQPYEPGVLRAQLRDCAQAELAVSRYNEKSPQIDFKPIKLLAKAKEMPE